MPRLVRMKTSDVSVVCRKRWLWLLRSLWCLSFVSYHQLKQYHSPEWRTRPFQFFTVLNQLVHEEDDTPQRKMIKIRSSCFSVTGVITPKCCCDSGIDSPWYPSSNHLWASCELDQLNSFKDVNKAERGAIFRHPACIAKGHLKDIQLNFKVSFVDPL